VGGVIRSRLAAIMTFEVLVRNDNCLVRVGTLVAFILMYGSCFWHPLVSVGPRRFYGKINAGLAGCSSILPSQKGLGCMDGRRGLPIICCKTLPSFFCYVGRNTRSATSGNSYRSGGFSAGLPVETSQLSGR
jgi:hypothetical protein